jgi:hypothetical protein
MRMASPFIPHAPAPAPEPDSRPRQSKIDDQDGVRLQPTQFGNTAVMIPRVLLDEPYPGSDHLALILDPADALKLVSALSTRIIPCLVSALTDAAAMRRDRAGTASAGFCADCQPGDRLCADHQGDLDAAQRYDAIAKAVQQ